jgi:hypothetical protein
MRLIVATLILAVAAPAGSHKDSGACKDRCGSTYQFCMSRAITKNAKKSCKADRKTCRSQCK